MTSIARELPDDPAAARAALYEGRVFQLAATPASVRLADDVTALLEHELGRFGGIRYAQRELSNAEFFERIGRIRKIIYTDSEYHQRVRDAIAGVGFDPAEFAFDPLRLRVIAHRGHENPLAAPIYYPHRDTWYGHPQALVTWWIPLHDLNAEETFVFYPERFGQAVPNNSEIFDYDGWVRDGWSLKIGWQDLRAGAEARYPGVLGEFDTGRAEGFATRRAENLLFSGAHFHRTLPHALGTTRFAVDFRVVHLLDHGAGRGAPNVDNRSLGSALPDYVHG